MSSSAATVPTSRLPNQPRKWLRRILGLLLVIVCVLAAIALGCHLWIHHAMRSALPQIDGTLSLSGLHSSVTVERDNRGVPHIRAANLDDLAFAQGFVTAQDRLWQMDTLRRHASGELAEVLGSKLIEHDKLQRYLQLRATADRFIGSINPHELNLLQHYADGVNASIAQQESHLPGEFRILRYKPAPWTPRDSMLVAYVMAQDLSTSFPDKLNREAVTAKLTPDLISDLYPVGSWRDHPPAEGKPDMTAPHELIEVPLDESQATLRTPEHLHDLEQVQQTIAPWVSHYACDGCTAGSNNWAVAGAHTANGRPLLANDMHLALGIPGIWFAADLESLDGSYHAAGVTLPGAPFVIVGHNQHIAWGFTNSGADVQDVYIEQVEGDRFRSTDGTWQPLHHQQETIKVRGGNDISFDVAATQHGTAITPILSPLYPKETRTLALRWFLYDGGSTLSPFDAVGAAQNWQQFREAFRDFPGPSENAVYADDQGHIGYQLMGKVPLRGDTTHPSGLASVPVSAGTYEWAGYIPYDQLPTVADPSSGILATANARITTDSYSYPIALDWESPYRNDRIWKVLSAKQQMTPADMTALQNDVFSALDQTLAQRIAYAVDHSRARNKRLHQAADILRTWDGNVSTNSAAANIAVATRTALWPMLLQPHLGDDWMKLYTWRSRTYALEEMLAHAPARWLPEGQSDWNELLTTALDHALNEGHAPSDLTNWKWGGSHSISITHTIYGSNWLFRALIGMHTGTGAREVGGNTMTVKAVSAVHGPSERFVDDPGDPDHATLTLPVGQSGDPASPWYRDQWPAWVEGTPLPLSWTTSNGPTHTLTLTPQ